jgi:hypothetical protein
MMTNTNEMLAPSAAAATMANQAVITACRVMYRAASFVGDPTFSADIRRAWNRGDAEMLVAYLDGLIYSVGQVEGAWDLWQELKAARYAVVSTEEVA